jgi:hypothetical protein
MAKEVLPTAVGPVIMITVGFVIVFIKIQSAAGHVDW